MYRRVAVKKSDDIRSSHFMILNRDLDEKGLKRALGLFFPNAGKDTVYAMNLESNLIHVHD